MSKKVLFLAQKMSMGFGVAVVVHHLCLELTKLGLAVEVACIEQDGSMVGDYPVATISPDVATLNSLIVENQITHVVAHTSPFFELIPGIDKGCVRMVWEHGDPTPELFPFDGQERKNIADQKRHLVYPAVDKVIAISEFIRSDINWPSATVIYNGCDHIRVAERAARNSDRLVVGALMRLGKGEAFYKGNSLFVELATKLQEIEKISIKLLGRGDPEDAKYFEERGIEVVLNADDEVRSQYLSSIDFFVSLSLWEGFNLPLVEAALSGALPLALDVGAHPEVTPYIFSSADEMAAFIKGVWEAKGRSHVENLANRTQSYVRKRFQWARAASEFAKVIG